MKRRKESKKQVDARHRRLKTALQSRDDYPLELVASLALKIGGPDWKQAARTAFELLEDVEEVAAERWARQRIPQLAAQENAIPFADAVKAITGNGDLEYATGKYRNFLERRLLSAEAPALGIVPEDDHGQCEVEVDVEYVADALIKSQRETGIPEIIVPFAKAFIELADLDPVDPPKRKKSRGEDS